MKLIVCLSCEAEFSIKHNMDKRLYNVVHCPLCGDELDNDMEDVGEYDEEYDDE